MPDLSDTRQDGGVGGGAGRPKLRYAKETVKELAGRTVGGMGMKSSLKLHTLILH